MTYYKIQFQKDNASHTTLNLVRTNIRAYGGYALSYVIDYDQNTRQNIRFSQVQVKQAIHYFKSHNHKNLANDIKNHIVKISTKE